MTRGSDDEDKASFRGIVHVSLLLLLRSRLTGSNATAELALEHLNAFIACRPLMTGWLGIMLLFLPKGKNWSL